MNELAIITRQLEPRFKTGTSSLLAIQLAIVPEQILVVERNTAT